MTADELLVPVGEDAPAGVDLDESAERERIRQAFDEPEGQDWRAVVSLIEAQCARTKDIWLAVYLARAGAQMKRLDIALTGCELLAGLLESYWETMFPSLEEYGFQGRKSACESLTRIGSFIGPLRRSVIAEHSRMGRFSGEDLERFEAEGDAAEGIEMFRRVIAELPPETLPLALSQLDSMRAALERADSALVERAEGDTGTDFSATYAAIATLRRAVAAHVPGQAEPVASEADVANDRAPRASGRIETREDVTRALDAIADYYRRREPGSAIPVALRRIRNWVSMDFMAVLADIAPGSIEEAGSVLVGKASE